MEVHVLEALSDNYMYLILDTASKCAAPSSILIEAHRPKAGRPGSLQKVPEPTPGTDGRFFRLFNFPCPSAGPERPRPWPCALRAAYFAAGA